MSLKHSVFGISDKILLSGVGKKYAPDNYMYYLLTVVSLTTGRIQDVKTFHLKYFLHLKHLNISTKKAEYFLIFENSEFNSSVPHFVAFTFNKLITLLSKILWNLILSQNENFTIQTTL